MTPLSKNMWKDLISLQPRTGGSGEGMSREDFIDKVAKDVRSIVPLTSMDIGQVSIGIPRCTSVIRVSDLYTAYLEPISMI